MYRIVPALSKRLLLAAVLAVTSISAMAQEATTTTTTTAEPLQEVIVTGTRIVTPNAVSTSPIASFNASDIQVTGKTDLSDILYQLPQILNNDVGQDFSNRTTGLSTPGGLSTVDLRGLGPNRTLVLVDGVRLGQGSPQTTIASPAPDIDQIPSFLVERIDVLTGGASSVYGADAVAGVVNFIMKKNFQGLQIDGQWGEDIHHNGLGVMDTYLTEAGYTPLTGTSKDGRNRTFNLIGGTNFDDDKGNFTVYLSYLQQDPVAGADRDIGQCQLTETYDANGNVNGSQCSGSSNSNRFTPLSGPNANTRYGVFGSSFVPWGTVATTPPALFNSQPYIYIQRQDNRYLAGFLAHEDLADYAKPYLDFSFMDDKTHQAVAPAAAFTTSNPNTGGPYAVNCGNPYLSAQEQGILGCTPAQISGNQSLAANQVLLTIGRRNVEGVRVPSITSTPTTVPCSA